MATRKRKHFLNKTEIAQLKDDIRQGKLGTGQMARKYDVSPSTVRKVARGTHNVSSRVTVATGDNELKNITSRQQVIVRGINSVTVTIEGPAFGVGLILRRLGI